MSSWKKDKQQLRKTYLKKRQALAAELISVYNRQLTRHLIEFLPWEQLRLLHTYLPITGSNEVDTQAIIDHIRTEYPEVEIAVPKVLPDDTLGHYLLEGTTQLELNKWGIPEPLNSVPVHIERIDLILVPMVIFDKGGNRIGYGKGHYDRFLSFCRADALKVGLCYFDPVERIEAEPQDVQLDAVVTPSRVWIFPN